jgi:(1->4)-alpha-D-glucan 1-alpha-D-glucosylmutase
MDILENGSSSQYFWFFDMDWVVRLQAQQKTPRSLSWQVLWRVSQDGEIALSYGPDGFSVTYYNIAFPLRIESYVNFLENLPKLKKQSCRRRSRLSKSWESSMS